MFLSDETADETRRRLHTLSAAELRDLVAGGGVEATAIDGSLSTGHLWPSSDIDVTIVPDSGPDWGVRWSVRDGIVVHRHLNRWALLEKLEAAHPASLIELAAGEWVRDPTWLLDGLMGLEPVHDPDGRLQRFSDFMRKRRFAPEVVEPRRGHLLARADAYGSEAGAELASGEGGAADSRLELAVETLAMVWLEAAGRVVSSKELDPELAGLCRDIGAPGAHSLFRAAAGAADLDRHLLAVGAAFAALLERYSAWLEPLWPLAPMPDQVVPPVAWWVYQRHRFWSMLYAPQRGCYMHMAAVRRQVEALDRTELLEFSASVPSVDADATIEALWSARELLLESFPVPPLAERLDAFHALHALTLRTFAS